jgi:hypothetical protein
MCTDFSGAVVRRLGGSSWQATAQLQLSNLSPLICQPGISVIGSSFVDRVYIVASYPYRERDVRGDPEARARCGGA